MSVEHVCCRHRKNFGFFPLAKTNVEMEIKMDKDIVVLGGHEFSSRFILGSGKYSLDLIQAAVEQAGAQIITLALRRA